MPHAPSVCPAPLLSTLVDPVILVIMLVFASVLLAVSSAFAYQVTYPGDSQGWNTAGPNSLKWERVSTDPLSFAVFLTNVNSNYAEILDPNIDGTLGSVVCSAPSGGWPAGSGFRVNIAQDAQHPDSLLAQSNQFNITAASSSGSTTISGTAASATQTSSAPGVSSSSTSTTPTGTSAASLGADAQAGLLTAFAALIALVTTLF